MEPKILLLVISWKLIKTLSSSSYFECQLCLAGQLVHRHMTIFILVQLFENLRIPRIFLKICLRDLKNIYFKPETGGSIWLSGPIIFIFTFPELSAILQILRSSSSSGLIPFYYWYQSIPTLLDKILKKLVLYLIINLTHKVFCIHCTFKRSHTQSDFLLRF